MDRLIQMFLNRLIGQVINRGIRAGLDQVAGPAKSHDRMTPEERKQAQEARKASQRAKQAANVTRRMMR
jgi:hypothetical protein